MNNHNLKRRRPYGSGASPEEPVLQEPSYSTPSGVDSSSVLPPQRYILDQPASVNVNINVPLSKLLDLGSEENRLYLLEQAASGLNVPLDSLVQLGRQRGQPHKRTRLNSPLPMSPPFPENPVTQGVHEKTPFSGQRTQPEANPRAPVSSAPDGAFQSGWTSTRLASCFANFSVCPPCSSYDHEPGYQAIPTTSYDYGSSRPYTDSEPSPIQQEQNPPYSSGPVVAEQANFMPCDDPAFIAQYMPNYPPLQPNRVTGVQPTTTGEGMVYPSNSINPRYTVPPEDEHTVLRARGESSPPNRSGPASAAFMNDFSPSMDRDGTFSELSPPYGMTPSYDEQDGLPKYHTNSMEIPPIQALPEVPPIPADFAYINVRKTVTARRGPFKDLDMREKTAHMRKIGSCIRCRMQRIRCDFDPENDKNPCSPCLRIANSRFWKQPCLRLKITDVKLYKPGQVKGHEWTSRWQNAIVDDIGNWASPETKIIRVTEGYTGKTVELRVRKFHPQAGDKLDRSWVSKGVKKSVSIPPYAIVDMEEAKTAFDRYIRAGLSECLKKLLGPREELLWRTYIVALDMVANQAAEAAERKLLAKTFDLWMSIRLTTKSFEIVGDETLGMSKDIINDPENALCGKVPLPPVMGAQIDSVLIHEVQAALRRETLEVLQQLTQEKRRKTWFTTYLATFILLHNIALITKHDADYARKHGMRRRFAREAEVKEYNLGATTLLAYFHYCNKGVYPFSEECRDNDLATLAGMNETMIQYVRDSRIYVTEHMGEWEELWRTDNYEDEYYYVSQLFENDWQPRVMT